MDKKMLLMEEIDFLFQIVPVMFAVIWMGQAIHTIFTRGWTAGVSLWFVFAFTIGIHATTVILVCSFFLYTFYNLDYLLTHIRLPVAMALTLNGFVFYDVIWAILDYVIAGIGKPYVNLTLFVGTWLIILLYNRKYYFLQKNKWFIFFFAIFIGLMLMLGFSGFFQAFHAWEETGVDPHNWLWFAGKFVGIWMWNGVYLKRGGLK